MNEQNKIQISKLNQFYGKKQVLFDVTLNIEQGMTGLLGRNGAGKTTLMKTMVTLLTPKSGKISICGTPIEKTKDIRQIIGYLPQEFSLYPTMKVWEVLDYLGVLSDLSKKQRIDKIDELLQSVNLQDERNKKVKALSGGMKRRLGVAQALLHDPKVLIADEPTVGLDPEERVRLRNLLTNIAKDKIVILSTHIVEDIEASCKKVAIMDEGHLKYHGTSAELLNTTGADSMETAYLRVIQSKEAL